MRVVLSNSSNSKKGVVLRHDRRKPTPRSLCRKDMAGLIDVSDSDTLSATGLFTELSDVSPNLEGSPWQAELDSMDIARSAHIESIAEEDERMGAPQPYADGIKHRHGELEGSSDLHGIMPMPSRRANGDQAPTPSHADADGGDGEGSDEGERMGGLALRHDGRDGGREGGAPFDGHDAFATSLDRIKHPHVDRLSEILGFILRKEPWEIKPEDAKLLIVSKLEGGAALQVPSQKHAKWVSKSEPHVFFVESDTQDAGDIEESDRQLISTSGADSHTVTQADDFIAVTRASSSSGKDSPYPKKVGQWQLALLKGHPDYGSDVFRGIQLKEARQIGREGIWCRIFGPKLVHSVLIFGPKDERVPDMNKRRKVGAGLSSVAGSSSA
jgi:hypothetical protein